MNKRKKRIKTYLEIWALHEYGKPLHQAMLGGKRVVTEFRRLERILNEYEDLLNPVKKKKKLSDFSAQMMSY